MPTATALDPLIRRRKTGFSLEQPFYCDPAVFDADIRNVFGRSWLFAGFASQAPNPGDYFTLELGHDALMIMRDNDGVMHALFNTCRHRGSRLCEAGSGHLGKIVCPYHQWTYERDGRLASARWMGDKAGDGFDKSLYGLHEAQLHNVAGVLFVCLGEPAEPFEPLAEIIAPYILPHQPGRTRTCAIDDTQVHANWKLLFENNRECYHCRSGHPEYCKVNFDLGMPGDEREDGQYQRVAAAARARWETMGLRTDESNFINNRGLRCARMPLREGCVTDSLDGQPVAPLLGDLPDRDTGILRLILFPNAWFHFCSDYIVVTQLLPLGPRLTRTVTTWLVHEDARPDHDYDPDRVAGFWRTVNAQDFKICEDNQRGINNSRYEPGPYAQQTEDGLELFVQWYLNRLASE